MMGVCQVCTSTLSHDGRLSSLYIYLENSIILGISHRDDQINAIVNTILTTTKWMIWKERNVAKYEKKKITKLKIINLIKSEISFIFSLAKSKTGNNIYTEMTNMFCI
jgi:hypothetical protein